MWWNLFHHMWEPFSLSSHYLERLCVSHAWVQRAAQPRVVRLNPAAGPALDDPPCHTRIFRRESAARAERACSGRMLLGAEEPVGEGGRAEDCRG